MWLSWASADEPGILLVHKIERLRRMDRRTHGLRDARRDGQCS